jgi:hypothetical protein
MKFTDYIKEQETDEDTQDLAPEETEIDDSQKDEMEDADEEVNDEDIDQSDEEDSDDQDDETASKIDELLPQILSGTFKALEKVTIPLQGFLDDTGLSKEDVEFWAENANEIYPDLTHALEIDGDNIVINEIGIDTDDEESEDDDFEIEGDDDEDEDTDDLFSEDDEEATDAEGEK